MWPHHRKVRHPARVASNRRTHITNGLGLRQARVASQQRAHRIKNVRNPGAGPSPNRRPRATRLWDQGRSELTQEGPAADSKFFHQTAQIVDASLYFPWAGQNGVNPHASSWGRVGVGWGEVGWGWGLGDVHFLHGKQAHAFSVKGLYASLLSQPRRSLSSEKLPEPEGQKTFEPPSRCSTEQGLLSWPENTHCPALLCVHTWWRKGAGFGSVRTSPGHARSVNASR